MKGLYYSGSSEYRSAHGVQEALTVYLIVYLIVYFLSPTETVIFTVCSRRLMATYVGPNGTHGTERYNSTS